MGRIFEKRKYKMFARFDRMAKMFTKIGKEIGIAVNLGGPLPEHNPRLRAAIQNAKGVNMPKDRIEAAIKRASSREEENYEEILYEGYAPHGTPLLVECATDNPTRTVANVRLLFSKHGGNLGNPGSVSYMFERKGVFQFDANKLNLQEVELDFIEAGAEDIQQEDDLIIIYTRFSDFGSMQAYLESKKFDALSVTLHYLPTARKQLQKSDQDDVLKVVEALEQDNDVQNVYHNLTLI